MMNVLSLFNGMSIGAMALEDAGLSVNKYYISEIDKYANQASNALFPDAIQLGSVTDWRDWDIDWSDIDLVTGGFPCQAWSLAGKQLGDKDERGMLFWVMLDIMKQVRHFNPKADFLIENVKMKKEFEEYITLHTENALGHVHKVLINSALVSAQNRQRYYWTSFEVSQPEDEGILLKDIIEQVDTSEFDLSAKCVSRVRSYNNAKKMLNIGDKSLCLVAGYNKLGRDNTFIPRPCELRDTQPSDSALCHHVATATDIKGNESIKRVYAETGKAPTLTTMGGGHRQPKVLVGRIVGRKINPETGKRDDYNPNIKTEQRLEPRLDEKSGCLTTVQKDNVLVTDYPKYRKLTPRECMRLQTVPEHYIETLLNAGISNTQLYKVTGNAWTMKVISHILKCMNK